MTQKTIAVIACATLLGSSDAFVPGVAKVQSRSSAATTSMSLQSHKASVGAFLAGVIALGGVMDVAPPAQADMLQNSPTTLLSGFGQPGALDDSSNNNAASGKENGPKYDIQQQGSFADKNSAGAVDYGSAKGTDFGKTAGNKDGVATENKATDGDFLAAAKKDTQQGTQIASKNTKDAANVDFGKDVRTSGAGTLGDSIKSAKDVVTGGATSSSAKWAGVRDDSQNAQAKANAASQKQWTTGPANTAKVPEKSLKNGFTASFRPKPAGAAEIEDVGQAIKNKAGEVARATDDLRNPNTNAALTGNSDVGNEVKQAANNPAGKAQKDLRTAKNNAPNFGNGEARQAANRPGAKVQKDLSTAKRAVQDAVPNGAQNAIDSVSNALKDNVVEKGSPASTLLSLNQDREGGVALSTDPAGAAQTAGQKTVDKVKDDIATARANPPFQDNSASNAASQVKGKVGSDVRSAKKTWQYGASNAKRAGRQIERTGKEFSLKNLGGGASGQVAKAKNNPQGKVKADLRQAGNVADNLASSVQSKVSSDINTAKRATPDAPKVGGLFGTQPKKQADITASKTANKVKSDVDNVKSGLLN